MKNKIVLVTGCLGLLSSFSTTLQGGKKKRSPSFHENSLGLLEKSKKSTHHQRSKSHTIQYDNKDIITTTVTQKKKSKLENFYDIYNFTENFPREKVLGKSWADFMSELRDPPSKEFLVNIGFYKPKEGEDFKNLHYSDIIAGGEKQLEEKKQRKKEKKENFKNNIFFQKQENSQENNDSYDDDSSDDELFVSTNFFETLSLDPMTCEENFFQKENQVLINENAILLENFRSFLKKNKEDNHELLSKTPKKTKEDNKTSDDKTSLPVDFYDSFMTYLQQIPSKFREKDVDFTEDYDILERDSLLSNTYNNFFYIYYINNIYYRLLGLLFDHDDLLEHFSFIVREGDFSEERTKPLKKAMEDSFSKKELMDFSLCASTFLFQKPFSMSVFGNSVTQSLFYNFFSCEEFIFFYKIPLSYGLYFINEKGEKVFKNLYFKDQGNNYTYQQSLDQIDFSKSIGLEVKYLRVKPKKKKGSYVFYDEKSLFAPFFSLDHKKEVLNFIKSYLHKELYEHDITQDIVTSSLCSLFQGKQISYHLMAFSSIIQNKSSKDYKNLLNIFFNDFRPLSFNFLDFEKTFYLSYCDFDAPHHPLMEENEKNFQRLIDNKKNHYTRKAKLKKVCEDLLFFKITDQEDDSEEEDFQKKINVYDYSLLFILDKKRQKKSLILDIKKYYFEEKKQEIFEDREMLRCFKTFSLYSLKPASKIFNTVENRLFKKMKALGPLIFSYSSNYKTFLKVIDHQALLNQRSLALRGRALFLQEIKENMAHELATFYFMSYRNFFFYQGMTHKENKEITYIDPVFLRLKILCHNILVPSLISIMKIKGKMNNKNEIQFLMDSF